MGIRVEMGNAKGVRRDFGALERRRFEAIRLLQQGVKQAEVARRLQVAYSSVKRWVHEWRTQGESGLEQAGRAGRRPQLGPEQRRRLVQLLLAGPQRLGYETPLWTCPRVADLIEREFGIRFHPGHVWKVLVSLGWSPQRPQVRARERNPEEIRIWKEQTWPALKKRPRRKAA